MAIYHLHVKVIGRKAGASAVASAAYRSASRLRDERIDRVQDFSKKRGVVYPWPFPGRPPRHDLRTWTVTDDWPDPVPVTEAEIEVFERWFGDLFDELFGSDG
jgi:hypothetical protein